MMWFAHARTQIRVFVLIASMMALAGLAMADAPVSVIDGDTVQIGGEVRNLYGVDAPELGQLCFHDGDWHECGQAAAFELKKLIDVGGAVHCEPAEQDRNQVICHTGNRNIGLSLIHAGYALAATGASSSYHEAERSAREGQLGLWHMALVSPWDWRHGRRLSEAERASEARCPIKAIVRSDGAKLYYVPTDGDYAQIPVDPAAGGRRFCSDAAAREAGWRRPGETG